MDSTMRDALFITFEGIEGCGKSTQIRLLEGHLQKRGLPVLRTREPGGTPVGEKIRQVLLNRDFKEMGPVTELLLYAAARAQHIDQVIRPALQAGKTVLCDRYADATEAYQGYARGLDKTLLKMLHKIAAGNLKPDLTFLLDCPVELGLARVRERNRFEEEAAAFHEKVRQGYLHVARGEPKRIKVIDAGGSVETIHRKIIAYVEKYTGA